MPVIDARIEPTSQTFVYVTVPPSGDHRIAAQAAADQAMAEGKDLLLGPGTWDFTTSGGIVLDDGVSDGTAAGFLLPKVRGLGAAQTTLLAPASGAAITYASGGRNGQGGGVYDLSILGPAITGGSIGIQMGGVAGDSSDLTTRMSIQRVQIDNVRSCIIADDVSILDIDSLRLVRYKYGFEWGYNVDDVRIKSLYAGHEQTALSGASCTITSGSNVITNLGSFVTDELQVGYCISAPGRFPAGCYVGSISAASGGSVTVVNHNGVSVNASASGTQVWFPLGRLFCFGTRVAPTAGSLYPSRGSPFVSPYWSTLFADAGGRISATNHEYQGLANDQEIICDMGGGSHSLVTLSLYQERFARLYHLGDPGSIQQPLSYFAVKNYYGQTQTVVASPMLVEGSTQLFGLTITDSFTDSAPLPYPWLRCDAAFGEAGLTWERNKLETAGNRTVQLGEASTDFSAQPNIRFNGAMYLGSAKKGDAIQNWINAIWFFYGQDVLVVDLAGSSKTVNLPLQYNTSSAGKELTLRIIANGSNTLTLASGWLDLSGADVGVIPAGSTGQVMEYVFRWTGSKFIATNEPVWITP